MTDIQDPQVAEFSKWIDSKAQSPASDSYLSDCVQDERLAYVSSHDVLVSIAQLLTELLAETKHLRVALGSSSRSSVELAENAKGGVQITTKAYVDSPLDDACVEAVAAFRTLKQEVERGQLEQWGSTVDALQNGTLR